MKSELKEQQLKSYYFEFNQWGWIDEVLLNNNKTREGISFMNELKVRNRVIVLSGEWLKKWRFVRKFMAMTKHTHLPPPPTCGGVSTINISYRQVSFELPLSSQLITVKINCTIKILFYSGGYWDRRVKRSEDEMKPPEFNFSPKF